MFPLGCQDLGRYVHPDRCIWFTGSEEKHVILSQLAELTAHAEGMSDPGAYIEAIFEREGVASTAIGGGIAMPHARLTSVEDFVISLGISPMGVRFDSQDGRPVHLIIMIASPEAQRSRHLMMLACIAGRLRDLNILQSIVGAPNSEAALQLFCRNPETPPKVETTHSGS